MIPSEQYINQLMLEAQLTEGDGVIAGMKLVIGILSKCLETGDISAIDARTFVSEFKKNLEDGVSDIMAFQAKIKKQAEEE